MKIYNCNKLLIDVNSNSTMIVNANYLIFDLSKVIACYEIILNNLAKSCQQATHLEVREFEHEELNILVLLGLTELGCSFIYNKKFFELSFAYAVPLCRDLFLKTYTINNLEVCLKNNQIVFLPCDSLYIIDCVDKETIDHLHAKEKRTIAKNLDTIILSTNFSEEFFDFWKWYDYSRYGEIQNESFVDFFKDVYAHGQFKLYTYTYGKEICGYNVCYFSQDQKVIYDVLFPWKKTKKVYRIGIYSIIKNLERAHKMGWGYSLCYGKYPYKDCIWNLMIK